MPSAVSPTPAPLPKWTRPVKTHEKLDWAEIKVIDISEFDKPGEKQRLAEELRDAVHKTGFFSITGTGLSQKEVERQYDIGQAYFNLPLEEKGEQKYRCDFGKGNYFGYRAVSSLYARTILHITCQKCWYSWLPNSIRWINSEYQYF